MVDEIEYFVPGQGGVTIAARLRAPVPAEVAPVYLRAYTRPGGLVLIPYCQGGDVVRDVLAEGRRAVALNFDPLMVLLARASLAPPSQRELDAAIARLGDSLKQDVPLRRYLQDLYATTCPACQRSTIASEFTWERDSNLPVTKQVRCAGCSWDGQSAVDAEDRARLEAVKARGVHYYFLLDRLAPRGTDARLSKRLEKMLALYSPRNLYALVELTIKIEALFDAGPLRDALKVLLLDCLERCSSLAPVADQGERRVLARQRLIVQPRFAERNVWLAFEQAVGRYMTMAGTPIGGLAVDPAQVQAGGDPWQVYVGQHAAREAVRLLPERSVRLLLSAPPPLDPTAWSLSYLWGAWLLSAEAVAPLRPLLQQRAPDAAWYARGLASSFRTVARLLADDGRVVFALDDRPPATVEGLLVAAAQAGLNLVSLTHSGADHRLVLAPGAAGQAVLPAPLAPDEAGHPPPPGKRQSPSLDLERAAVTAAVATIRARGEPVRWPTLHAAMWSALAQAGLLAAEPEAEGPAAIDRAVEAVRRAGEAPELVLLPAHDGGEPFYWLADPTDLPDQALSDRVEAAAYGLVEGALALTELQFTQALYERCAGRLSPEPDLVALALRAYAHQASPGYWQLRSEDGPGARDAERASVVEQLHLLGRRLHHTSGAQPPFDVVWQEGTRPRALFAVRWQASVSDILTLGQAPAGAQPYLVLPGGRAALAAYKLAHNPVWQRAVDAAGWHFIKYRHVRQLASEPEVNEYLLRTIVGLDPIVEREGAQIPLF